MRYLKIVVVMMLLLSLSGCWFIFIPLGPIVRAIQGPRYCVGLVQKVGDRITTPGGKTATIMKLHGEDHACINPSHPVLANVVFDEERP